MHINRFQKKIKIFKLHKDYKIYRVNMYVHIINSEEFVFLTSNFNDWNYNTMTDKAYLDPFNSNKRTTCM